MPQFKFRVTETRTVSCDYCIEAADEKSARELAETGETTLEVELSETMEVINREIERRL